MDKLRMGLIGCGNMMRQHLRGVDQVKEVEFVAVCDVVRENAEKKFEASAGPMHTSTTRLVLEDVLP